jgi:hypothetical protein
MTPDLNLSTIERTNSFALEKSLSSERKEAPLLLWRDRQLRKATSTALNRVVECGLSIGQSQAKHVLKVNLARDQKRGPQGLHPGGPAPEEKPCCPVRRPALQKGLFNLRQLCVKLAEAL